MVTLMFGIAATLLVVCLIQCAALLNAKSMLDNANKDIDSLERFAKRREGRIAELDTLASQVNETIETITKQRDDAIEEVTRISCELAVAKLSLKNAQDQVAEHVAMTGRAVDDREEYRDMLKNIAHIFANERDLLDEVLKEWKELEQEGW